MADIRYCDVVMKGGITSGVVYPGAVVKLAETFHLKSIGGTSAGAIAAAAAAAAELGEIKGASGGGYKELKNLPVFLSTNNDTDNTNLFTFFQPQPATRKLYATLTSALGANKWKKALLLILANTLWRFPAVFVLCVVAGVTPFFYSNFSGKQPLEFSWLVVWLLLGCVALAARLTLLFVNKVPGTKGGNYFGLCSGMSTNPEDDNKPGQSAGGQALTVWLTKYLNELAGLASDGAPLTFGQLWDPDTPAGSPPKAAEKAIRLEMFTTCLTMGRPFLLPFQSDADAKENVFYFKEDDFRKFFPQNVVQWMKANERGLSPGHTMHRPVPKGTFRMPDPWNLPVVVATRMSLSFPILLSAVRLCAFESDLNPVGTQRHAHAPDAGGKPAATGEEPSHCWFSDGGLCNNFPIHLFDSPLPRWPTFGMNLVNAPKKPSKAELKPWMPATNNEGIQEPFTELDEGTGFASFGSFLGAILNTMQNWSDNTLSRMPGYRDRITQIPLKSTEGGLNLNMPKEIITALSDRGVEAADEFAKRFSDGIEETGKMNWANHRWLRFRSMIAALEEMIISMDEACTHPVPPDAGYEAWVKTIPMRSEPSYKWESPEQRELAIKTLEDLRKLAALWEKSADSAAVGAPRPRPELRPRPRI